MIIFSILKILTSNLLIHQLGRCQSSAAHHTHGWAWPVRRRQFFHVFFVIYSCFSVSFSFKIEKC
jgi:hypothetical protein